MEFAFINEVWGNDKLPKAQPKQSPACAVTRGEMDNIMAAYIKSDKVNEDLNDPHLNFVYRNNKPTQELDGYNSMNAIYSQVFPYDGYYANELRDLKTPTTSEECNNNNKTRVTTEGEDAVLPFSREHIYKDVVEKYVESTNFPTNVQIELFVYIISGIFLIFFMEQILQLGTHL